MKLLICGSRAATPPMLDYATRAVARAHAWGWEIVVGDAAGVDARVIEACCKLGVPFTIWGVQIAPRNICCNSHLKNYRRVYGRYLDRDRAMVDASDRILAIWNGDSRGTKYTYDYAVKYGKQADLRTFQAVTA